MDLTQDGVRSENEYKTRTQDVDRTQKFLTPKHMTELEMDFVGLAKSVKFSRIF